MQEIIIFRGLHSTSHAGGKASRFSKKDKNLLLSTIMKPFYQHLFEDIIQGLINNRYKKDLIQKESIDIILNSFQKYVDSHTQYNQGKYSRESLTKLAAFFNKELQKLERNIKEECVCGIIAICQGYGLFEFVNKYLIEIQLAKLVQQLSFLFQ